MSLTNETLTHPVGANTKFRVVLAAAAGLLVGIAGTLVAGSAFDTSGGNKADEAPDTRLVDAIDGCMAVDGMELGDGDTTLVIDVQGEDDISGASYADQQCVLSRLEMPASVESHINQTTSMDGRQTESWDGITIEWSYHPDRGGDMVVTLDEPK